MMLLRRLFNKLVIFFRKKRRQMEPAPVVVTIGAGPGRDFPTIAAWMASLPADLTHSIEVRL